MASSFPSRAPRRALVGTFLAAAALVCACGARGPLDIIVIEEAPADASTSDGSQRDASADHDKDGSGDATPDVLDAALETAMGMDTNPIFNCGTCLANNCGTQLATCITSPGCGAALQCVATMCAGAPSLGCLTGCTMGNSTTEGQLLAVIGCVIGNCGADGGCTSLLGGLGGGGGGGGG